MPGNGLGMQRLSWRLLHPLDSCDLDFGLHETHTYQAYRFLLQQTSGYRDGAARPGGTPAAPALCLPQPSFPRPAPRGTSVSPTLAPSAARVQPQESRTVLGAQHGAVGKVWSPAGGARGRTAKAPAQQCRLNFLSMARRKARCGARLRPSVVAQERSGRAPDMLLLSGISHPLLILLL